MLTPMARPSILALSPGGGVLDPGGPFEQAAAGPGWSALAPWLLACLVALAGYGVYLLARLARSAEEQRGIARNQQLLLGELRDRLARLEQERAVVDLRRIEHLLIDARDGQVRLEDALLRSVERAAPGGVEGPARPAASAAEELIERVQNRLLAMGYERVQVVSGREQLETLAGGRGEVLVEARRGGVIHKGKLSVVEGRILDVAMLPPYALFP
jgi:hypothetical protein